MSIGREYSNIPFPAAGLIPGLVALGLLAAVPARADELSFDFENGLEPWEPLPSGTWRAETIRGDGVASLVRAGTQREGIRRPTAYLFLPGEVWRNLTFTLRARTSEPDSTINRDICLIFGYLDDTHYYYAHVSSNSDDAFHNVIMKVDGTERETIHRETAPEARLTGAWHTLRVTHEETGRIEVFVDDMESPLMTAMDDGFRAGSVAFGCFDDRARFDDVVVEGERLSLLPPELTIGPSARGGHELRYFAQHGFVQQLRSSGSLDSWDEIGDPVLGDGITMVAPAPLDGPAAFYQLNVMPPRLGE